MAKRERSVEETSTVTDKVEQSQDPCGALRCVALQMRRSKKKIVAKERFRKKDTKCLARCCAVLRAFRY